MEATTLELGPVSLWSPKSSSFSGSDSIVVEEAARNFLSPRPSIKQSGAPNFFVQHDKVEASKLRRYLETCGRALEQFRPLTTLPYSPPLPVAQYSGNESSCNLQHFGV